MQGKETAKSLIIKENIDKMANACEKCRREGAKLLLKGEKCLSGKCTIIKRPYAPGDHGQGFYGKRSEYGRQLREKQKTKRIYGMRETQFANYVDKADKMIGNTSLNLMRLLELRLDNIIYRLGLAVSRASARQIVSHGGILINGKKVNIASYIIKVGDVIEPKFKERFKEATNSGVSSWIEFDAKKLSAKIKHLPLREEIDTPINENLIIEFYSR